MNTRETRHAIVFLHIALWAKQWKYTFWKFVKVKKYYMLIFGPKIFIPFVNGVKLPKILLGIKFNFF